MAGEGLRVLCIAYKRTSIHQGDQVSTRSAVRCYCSSSLYMVAGQHVDSDPRHLAFAHCSSCLNYKFTDAEIDSIDELPLVIARCSPATKVRMVEAMHNCPGFEIAAARSRMPTSDAIVVAVFIWSPVNMWTSRRSSVHTQCS
jgi:Na+-exporting ATPase